MHPPWQVFCKPAGTGKSVPYHQDGPYWPIVPLRACSAWIALDDADAANGALRVLPGTHAAGAVKHVKRVSEAKYLSVTYHTSRVHVRSARMRQFCSNWNLASFGTVIGLRFYVFLFASRARLTTKPASPTWPTRWLWRASRERPASVCSRSRQGRCGAVMLLVTAPQRVMELHALFSVDCKSPHQTPKLLSWGPGEHP